MSFIQRDGTIFVCFLKQKLDSCTCLQFSETRKAQDLARFEENKQDNEIRCDKVSDNNSSVHSLPLHKNLPFPHSL